MYRYGTGDNGVTAHTAHSRGSKTDTLIQFYGVLDELTAGINLAEQVTPVKEISLILTGIIKDLYDISAAIYMQKGTKTILDKAYVDKLEMFVEKYRDCTISDFVKFNCVTAAQINMARTICRRAEFTFFTSSIAKEDKYATIGVYLNRLSSLLFHLAASFHNNTVIKELL